MILPEWYRPFLQAVGVVMNRTSRKTSRSYTQIRHDMHDMHGMRCMHVDSS